MLNKINEGIRLATSREDILIAELEKYGARKAKEKNKYSCVYCSSSNALDVRTKKGKATYKCFSCGEYGDIVNLISNKETLSKKNILNYLEEKYSIGWQVMGEIPKVAYRRPNISEDKKKELENSKALALSEGNLVKAIKEDNNLEELNNSPLVIFKDVGAKGEPLQTWENLEILLKTLKIYPVNNVITKDIELLGVPFDDYNNQVTHIHSLCLKYGLHTSITTLDKQIRTIASKNKFNPAKDYLEECHRAWDEISRIDDLLSTLKIEDDFPRDIAISLIVKWFLNAVNIAYNTGHEHTRGVLVFQGGQGIGKTTWIKNLVPHELFAEGKSLKPDRVDSVRQATNKWIVELGELDGTTKGDQATLKAYITNRTDTYRVPYSIKEITVPRNTIYFGTVNEDSFLKDDTGTRRWWVIPIISIDWEKLKSIDKEQLWGEFVQLYEEGESLDLTRDEIIKLNELNREFSVIGITQSKIATGFAWDSPKDTWQFMSTKEIMVHLGLQSNKGMKAELEQLGAERARRRIDNGQVRGYIVPRFIKCDTFF